MPEASKKLVQECEAPQPVKGCIAACVAMDGVMQEACKHYDLSEIVEIEKSAAQRVKNKSKEPVLAKPRASAKLIHWGHFFEITKLPKSNICHAAQ